MIQGIEALPQTSDGLSLNPFHGQVRPDAFGVQHFWDDPLFFDDPLQRL